MDIKCLIDTIVRTTESYPDTVLSRPGMVYTCINSYKYHFIKKKPEVFMSVDGIMVDGILMCMFIRWLWGYNVRRLSFDMTAIAKDLFPMINENRAPIYFIGDSQEMIDRAVKNFKEFYPDMNIVGYHSGFFISKEDRSSIIREIIALKPLYTIVGMGAVVQEQFVIDLKAAGYNGIAFTCGGYFHQAAVNISYYPSWIDKCNLRWLYRIVKEKNDYKRRRFDITFIFRFVFDTITSKLSSFKRQKF